MPFFTGPVKPIASSTRSASSVNSVPGSGSNFGDGPARGMQLLHVAVFVAGELHRVDAPIAHAAFFVRAFDAQLHRPQRPRRRRRARVRRLGQQFELRDRARALPMAGAQAIGARIAAADDDHALAGGQNLVAAPYRLRTRDSAAAETPWRNGCPSVRARARSDSRGCSAPPASRMASNSCRRSSTGTFPPTCALVSNFTPSARICSSRRSIRCFSILKFGMP